MKFLFSTVFVLKLSICIVTLSSLHFKLQFSPVALAPYHLDHSRSFQNVNWQQNAKV